MNLYNFLLNHKKITNILIRNGVMPLKYSQYIEIYTRYTELKDLNIKNRKAVHILSEMFKVTPQTIYTTIREMQSNL